MKSVWRLLEPNPPKGSSIEVARVLAYLLLALAAAATSVASADELVIDLEKRSLTGSAGDGSPARPEVAQSSVPRGLPRTLRLPLEAASDGSVSFSLRQEAVDASIATDLGERTLRVRVVSPGLGTVADDARGGLSIGINTTIAFDNLATGESRVFDIRVQADARSDTVYGADIPIHLEGWRRGEDGKPVENPTHENRSFWGTVAARFERSE